MARNVGKKRGAQPRPSSGGGGGSGRKSLVAFAVGLFAGVALAGGIYLLGLLPTSMELRDREIACNDIAGGEKKPADESNSSEPAADKKPVTFQFYDMLTKQQTVAPVAGRNTTNNTTTRVSATLRCCAKTTGCRQPLFAPGRLLCHAAGSGSPARRTGVCRS
jgi:hypothetical protein